MIVIIIPTLLSSHLSNCIESIYSNVDMPVRIYLSVGYNNFSKSCNDAFNNIRSDWVLFLNDDIIIRNNFIKYMMETANRYNADIVGAKLIYPNNTIQHAGVYFRENKYPYHVNLSDSNMDIVDKIVPAVTGACMMIKSSVFIKLGGFDDKYINGFEDIDLCIKANMNKYIIALCGSTNIVHYEKSTRDSRDFKYNLDRLLMKW